MSRHEGVSCDACMRTNFTGIRYKCLVCYDYDLCATCYYSAATSSRHSADHPMQGIPTRTDCNVYFGGEVTPSMPQVQSYTCPLCSMSGFTVTTLQEHTRSSHTGSSTSAVVCPICASQSGGDPNYVTDDLASHISLVHQTSASAATANDTAPGSNQIRRLTHPSTHTSTLRATHVTPPVIPFILPANSSSGAPGARAGTSSNISSLQLGGAREPSDPMAELLSQLSSARSRTFAAQGISLTTQLHQLEVQLASTKQQLERLKQIETTRSGPESSSANTTNVKSSTASAAGNTVSTQATASGSEFLLKRHYDKPQTEQEKQKLEVLRTNHSAFIQELLLSSLSHQPSSSSSNLPHDFNLALDNVPSFSELSLDPRNGSNEADGSLVNGHHEAAELGLGNSVVLDNDVRDTEVSLKKQSIGQVLEAHRTPPMIWPVRSPALDDVYAFIEMLKKPRGECE